MKGKFMIVNSEYDSWAILTSLVSTAWRKESRWNPQRVSKAEMNYIEKYRAFYRQTLAKFLTVNPESRIWSIACSNHVYACLQ